MKAVTTTQTTTTKVWTLSREEVKALILRELGLSDAPCVEIEFDVRGYDLSEVTVTQTIASYGCAE